MNTFEFLNQTTTITTPDVSIFDETSIGDTTPCKVILFNDNIHSFDEVIIQLIKAIHCTTDRAAQFAWEVHTRGKACVFSGDMPDCLKVSGVLEEIGLNTQIEM